MGQTNNAKVQRLVKNRNRLFDQITFYEHYPSVYEKQIDAQNARHLKKLENKTKNMLLPLELEAKPAAEVNKWRIDKEMRAAEAAQAPKRRAIQQEYVNQIEQSGEQAAAQQRDNALAMLDSDLEKRRAELEAKYPLDSKQLPSPKAISAYQKAEEEAERKLDAERARLAEEKRVKTTKVNTSTAGKLKKLQTQFDAYNEKMDQFSKISEEEFGSDTLLRIQNLKMYFSGVKAVDDISFDIKKGEIFGLIGPNGAGKTTIFNCVTQFYKPTAGNVFYRDRFGKIVDLTDYKTHDVIKCGISRTFQNLEMVLGLSILDNMKVGAHSMYRTNLLDHFLHTKRLKDEEDVTQALAEDILKRLDLLQYKNDLPKGQPYGVLKKVELGRTLMTRPQMIILDEPAAGLNDVETEELAKTIRQIRDEFGCTIFLVEHDMNLVMNICDTICVTSFGKRLAIGTPKEIQANPAVQEAYLGVEGEDDE